MSVLENSPAQACMLFPANTRGSIGAYEDDDAGRKLSKKGSCFYGFIPVCQADGLLKTVGSFCKAAKMCVDVTVT